MGPEANSKASELVYKKYVNLEMKSMFVFACGGMIQKYGKAFDNLFFAFVLNII